ncbi:histidine phosphatase family protein [Campylobacter sp. VicNov18]|uniref:SixA phosphatase family protein n=1 Tax=Campylobacter bilis TaxID=2691918 RepID=UPI00130D4A4D|nr:histidine phosphatase family protein [Campylobacter bilis]MPV63838.1 histidine phosphatase family protein [Campylobacter hepaticus]MBM0637339.1 histidine phosphatase family protein [Campylobacter bilis]MCC8278058.1 histidine phosphatase family protein [Campylobacter bilis]MCC8299562.1 histidine phosphatase family protein [Campylobacter bilis]MCC8300967.1 histidine phosphatase family protein [Campylobacter bilis]
MKKIYIIRHAKANKDKSINDFDRKLAKSGKEDLKKLCKNLAVYQIQPDFILSSPAIRTAKTAKKLAKFCNFNKNKIQFNKKLYLGNVEVVLKILQGIDNKFNEIFLIGHNPVLIELGELLSSLCLASFPTSSILCLEFNIDEFENLKEHTGKLVFFEHVRKLKEEKDLDF